MSKSRWDNVEVWYHGGVKCREWFGDRFYSFGVWILNEFFKFHASVV